MKVRFAQEARSEFAEAARWYAREAGTNQARAFRNEILRIIQLLTEHPDMGTPITTSCRRMTAHRFPYDVVYHHNPEILRVIAIAHHSRRPGYWAERR